MVSGYSYGMVWYLLTRINVYVYHRYGIVSKRDVFFGSSTAVRSAVRSSARMTGGECAQCCKQCCTHGFTSAHCCTLLHTSAHFTFHFTKIHTTLHIPRTLWSPHYKTPTSHTETFSENIQQTQICPMHKKALSNCSVLIFLITAVGPALMHIENPSIPSKLLAIGIFSISLLLNV